MTTTAVRSTPFDLEVRKSTRFDFTGLEHAMHTEGNLYTSHFFNALSLMTPITEGILIRAIRESQPLLAGTGLEADAKAFIGQEAVHTREHRELNRQLAALGFDTQEVIDDIEAKVEQLEKSLTLQERLAVVITGEHVIYSVARALLTSGYCDAEQQEEVKRLFLWHALEEMEHQSVCDDIYRHLYGTGIKHKLIYYRIFLLASKLLLGMILKLFKGLLAQSRTPENGELKLFLSWLLVKPGVGSITAKELLAFFTPWFDHWKRSKEDKSLINQNLRTVYGATEA